MQRNQPEFSNVPAMHGIQTLLHCSSVSSVCFLRVVLCGFKKGQTRITSPFQSFPDLVLLLSLLPIRHHVLLLLPTHGGQRKRWIEKGWCCLIFGLIALQSGSAAEAFGLCSFLIIYGMYIIKYTYNMMLVF